jgi:hypothetical protein
VKGGEFIAQVRNCQLFKNYLQFYQEDGHVKEESIEINYVCLR